MGNRNIKSRVYVLWSILLVFGIRHDLKAAYNLDFGDYVYLTNGAGQQIKFEFTPVHLGKWAHYSAMSGLEYELVNIDEYYNAMYSGGPTNGSDPSPLSMGYALLDPYNFNTQVGTLVGTQYGSGTVYVFETYNASLFPTQYVVRTETTDALSSSGGGGGTVDLQPVLDAVSFAHLTAMENQQLINDLEINLSELIGGNYTNVISHLTELEGTLLYYMAEYHTQDQTTTVGMSNLLENTSVTINEIQTALGDHITAENVTAIEVQAIAELVGTIAAQVQSVQDDAALHQTESINALNALSVQTVNDNLAISQALSDQTLQLTDLETFVATELENRHDDMSGIISSVTGDIIEAVGTLAEETDTLQDGQDQILVAIGEIEDSVGQGSNQGSSTYWNDVSELQNIYGTHGSGSGPDAASQYSGWIRDTSSNTKIAIDVAKTQAGISYKLNEYFGAGYNYDPVAIFDNEYDTHPSWQDTTTRLKANITMNPADLGLNVHPGYGDIDELQGDIVAVPTSTIFADTIDFNSGLPMSLSAPTIQLTFVERIPEPARETSRAVFLAIVGITLGMRAISDVGAIFT